MFNRKQGSVKILDGAIALGAGSAHQPVSPYRTFHSLGSTSAGAGAATILIEVSDVDVPTTNDWLLLATHSLTLSTTSSGDKSASQEAWRHVRARVSVLSGTGASVSVWLGA